MLTLTLPAHTPAGVGGDGVAAGIALQAHAWRSLSRWLKRNADLREYMWCREITKLQEPRPNLHQHVLFNSEYVPTEYSKRKYKSLLNQAIVRAGYGSVFKINKVKGPAAQWYVTKYVSKCTQSLPRYTRRVQTNVRDVRVKEPGWHFLSNGGYEAGGDDSLFSMCAHGSTRYRCPECSEGRVVAAQATRDARRGLTLDLNLIPSMKNCVTRDTGAAWLLAFAGPAPPE